MQISIIIPLLNEQESLPELHLWIVKVMSDNNYLYEIIFIDDGSTEFLLPNYFLRINLQ